MSIRDRLRTLEEAAEGETLAARCEGGGEEMRIRQGILLDVTCLEWQMHQEGTAELPADTTPRKYHGCGSILATRFYRATKHRARASLAMHGSGERMR